MLAFPIFTLFARIRQWRKPPAAPHVSDNLVDQAMPCGRILQGRFRVPERRAPMPISGNDRCFIIFCTEYSICCHR